MKEPKIDDAEQAYSASREASAIPPLLLTKLFDYFKEAVIVADTNRRIICVNSVAEGLFGYSKNELYGEKTRIL